MNKQEFIDLFVEEVEIEDVVTEETELKSLPEWDSMAAMVTIGLVSDNFQIILKSQDMLELTTVGSLIEKIGLDKFSD